MVTAETVRITHAVVEVACHRRSAGRRGRIIDDAHFAGVAGSAGRVMASSVALDVSVAMSALRMRPV